MNYDDDALADALQAVEDTGDYGYMSELDDWI